MNDRAHGLGTQVKAALARWVLQKRRGAAATRPAAHDEATHAWDGRRRFAEDYAFAAVQSDVRLGPLGLLVRLEWLPGRAAHRVWLMVLGAGQSWWIPPEQQIVAQPTVDRWRVGGLALDCAVPLEQWTLRYDGPLRPTDGAGKAAPRCRMDLVFDATTDPFVPGVDDDPDLIARRLGEAHWDPALLRAVRRATQRGYVQVGRIGGTVALADTVMPVDAMGVRQHTWGVRDWGAPEHAAQCLVVDGDEVAWVQSAAFPELTIEGGFVAQGRHCVPITAAVRVARDDERCALEVDLPGGRRAWSGASTAQTSMRVDGRGAFDLAFVAEAGGIRGLWATQRRTLPSLAKADADRG
jgi:hypothetical protein